jgi:hypothetical protein
MPYEQNNPFRIDKIKKSVISRNCQTRLKIKTLLKKIRPSCITSPSGIHVLLGLPTSHIIVMKLLVSYLTALQQTPT